MKKLFLPIILILSAFLTSTFAQTATEISPEKRELISKIVSITKADKKTEEVMRAMMGQINDDYPAMVEGLLNNRGDFTSEQKADLKRILIEKNKEAKGFQETLLKSINFQEYIEQTFYPLYDKFFTENELKDLLKFYETDTGKKLNDILPQLSAESTRLAQAYLIPKINQVFQEMINDARQNKSNIKNKNNPK